jgi:hypothetical protein
VSCVDKHQCMEEPMRNANEQHHPRNRVVETASLPRSYLHDQHPKLANKKNASKRQLASIITLRYVRSPIREKQPVTRVNPSQMHQERKKKNRRARALSCLHHLHPLAFFFAVQIQQHLESWNKLFLLILVLQLHELQKDVLQINHIHSPA